ncbi:MAG: FAD-dependent oxidoreductase [Anaerolineae bacterium]|nr:FAD-dependent oxidoreductase [Gloeobacterales cyanobacterium ES-bin-313]
MKRWWIGAMVFVAGLIPTLVRAETPKVVECDLFVAGGGLGGVAAALEALQMKKKVCMSEITDWVGGQATQQGVSALDERPLQRSSPDLFPKGYSNFRKAVREKYGGETNPGRCWVSELCFSPRIGAQVLSETLEPYRRSGQLVLLHNTVVKDINISGNQIQEVTTITHSARKGAESANSRPLSYFLLDWYDPNPSEAFLKTTTRFIAPESRRGRTLPWMVIDATETGELLPLAGIPYRLGTDPQTRYEPSASPNGVDPYCTQGFTYPFVMEQVENAPETPDKPSFYDSPFHGGYYSYEKPSFDFAKIFTYRRIKGKVEGLTAQSLSPGDQTLQNWTWGNDWRLSTSSTNLVLTQEQLETSGQLLKSEWKGGLRPQALRDAEDHALGYFYWLVAGRTDSRLQKLDPVYQKPLYPNYAFLRGAESPMGTEHGLSRYPYIREARRIIGRPSMSYPNGFAIYEMDISRARQDELLNKDKPYLFFDSVGVGQYPIDFHPCLKENFEGSTSEAREAPAASFPYQVPLRALIPQKIDNLLVSSKNIATTHITNGAYRVHPVEWSIGAAAGTTSAFALDEDAIPANFVTQTPQADHLLYALKALLKRQGNPYAFENATIFETKWADHK